MKRLICCCSHCEWGFCVGSLFCCVVLGALSSLAIILLRARELVALCCGCLCLFLMVQWVGLQSVIIVAFPGHTHFLSGPSLRPRSNIANATCTEFCVRSINSRQLVLPGWSYYTRWSVHLNETNPILNVGSMMKHAEQRF